MEVQILAMKVGKGRKVELGPIFGYICKKKRTNRIMHLDTNTQPLPRWAQDIKRISNTMPTVGMLVGNAER
jgi:hypothetical protein